MTATTATTAKPPIVVIGTTLGEASDQVVATGAGIARRMGAVLHLVNAFDVPAVAAGAPFALGLLPGSPELEKEGRERLLEQVARLRLGGGRGLVQHVEPGPPHRVLSEVARREAADLIVVGATDNLAAHVFGSTARRVVRKAQCPVLVLRGALPLPPRQVLLPIDLSPISGEVVGRGLALLERWCGAGVGTGTGAPGDGRQGCAVEALHVVAPRGYAATATTASEVAASRRLGRLPRSGLPRVRMTKMTRTCVASDSTNQPVWKRASWARKTCSITKKVRKSKTELTGPGAVDPGGVGCGRLLVHDRLSGHDPAGAPSCRPGRVSYAAASRRRPCRRPLPALAGP